MRNKTPPNPQKKSPPKKYTEVKYLTIHTNNKSSDRLGADLKKNQSSQKNYTHEIFNKRNSIQKVRSSQNLNNLHSFAKPLMQYKSSQNLGSKQKKGSVEVKQTLDQVYTIKYHQRDTNKMQEKIPLEQVSLNNKLLQQEQAKNKDKQINQQEQIDTNNQFYTHINSKSTAQISTQSYSEDRQFQILNHRNQSNIKFLIAQTNQLLSFFKFLTIQEQTNQVKKKTSELNIQIRKLKIVMRNHQYTNQINFTSPIAKHNDQFVVKMPETINENQIQKYLLVLGRLEQQKEKQKILTEKLENLEVYQEFLQKKHQNKLDLQNSKSHSKLNLQKIQSQLSSNNNKLKKVLQSGQLSSKGSFAGSSLKPHQSINNKNIKNKANSIENSQQKMNQHKQTLEQKKIVLKEFITDFNQMNGSKINRLKQQINMLKKQLSMIDQNIKSIDQKKQILIVNIEKEKTRNCQKQDEQNSNKQYLKLINKRKTQYQKQKIRNTNEKGFTLLLRQNKSPVNYLTNSNHAISPRNAINNNLNNKNNIQKNFIKKNKSIEKNFQTKNYNIE